MLSGINLKEALDHEKAKLENNFLTEVQSILNKERRAYQDIYNRIKIKPEHLAPQPFDEMSEIYELKDIRKVCIRYGLRFLDSRLYKGEFPSGVSTLIKEREQTQGQPFKSFKVMAPAKLFRLVDENADPLLFGLRNDGRFEFIAQWGNDLSWFRALSTYPSRNPLTLVVSVFLMAIATIFSLPNSIFQGNLGLITDPNVIKVIVFFFFLIITTAATSYCWLAFGKRFSSRSWNSESF